MRSYLPNYTLRSAVSLDEALTILASEPGVWRPFAGGTDLMVLLEAGSLVHRNFVSLWGIRKLRNVEVANDSIAIGALTTYSDVLKHSVLREEFPLLCEAASQTGGVATQNRGTLGGNIGNASPAADTPPALLVYDAEVELMSASGSRRVPYDQFHTGYKTSVLAPEEIIARIHLPRRRGWKATYRKVGTRRAQAIAKVCFAASAQMDGTTVRDVRIAFGSIAPTVVRATAAERAVRGRDTGERTILEAQNALDDDIKPIDDIRSTAGYRGAVSRRLLAEFLSSLSDDRRR
jgi:CO/xanthine dehydrogenase FAD-binding subunit